MLGDHPAAERFEGERETVMVAYAGRLAAVGSPLVAPGRWSRVRRQAEGILRECGAGLRGEQIRFSDADLVTLELMGARRALDGVPMRESLRAARILWLATAPCLRRAVADLPEAEGERLLRTGSQTFRRSARTRLSAGAAGYCDRELQERLRDAGPPGSRSASVPSQRTHRAGVPDHGVPDHGVPDHGVSDHGVLDHGVHSIADRGIPAGGVQRRIADALGVPEADVRTALRAAIRRADRADRAERAERAERREADAERRTV